MVEAVALVPIKPAHRAKARLGARLGRRARRALSRAMLRDVLATLTESALFLSVIVVTRDRALRRPLRRMGIHVLQPPPGVRGLNRELQWAADRPEVATADRLLVLPGDVPGVSLTDLFRLVLPPIEQGIRLAVAADGGTNALLLAPPSAIRFRFGRDSARRHARAAEQRGLSATLLTLPSLVQDIDNPVDLGRDQRIGPHTRRVLAALERPRFAYRRK